MCDKCIKPLKEPYNYKALHYSYGMQLLSIPYSRISNGRYYIGGIR